MKKTILLAVTLVIGLMVCANGAFAQRDKDINCPPWVLDCPRDPISTATLSPTFSIISENFDKIPILANANIHSNLVFADTIQMKNAMRTASLNDFDTILGNIHRSNFASAMHKSASGGGAICPEGTTPKIECKPIKTDDDKKNDENSSMRMLDFSDRNMNAWWIAEPTQQAQQEIMMSLSNAFGIAPDIHQQFNMNNFGIGNFENSLPRFDMGSMLR